MPRVLLRALLALILGATLQFVSAQSRTQAPAAGVDAALVEEFCSKIKGARHIEFELFDHGVDDAAAELVFGPDLTVLPHIAAGLPHKPDGPHIRRPPPAGIQKSAVHWSHAHVCSDLSSHKKMRNPWGRCRPAHDRPRTK